jgi:hypothetical protein
MSLPEALEQAASALAGDADAIRPANGDPGRLLTSLDEAGRLRVLGWLLREQPVEAAELAEAWAEEAEGQAVLLAVDAEGLPKAARKTLRRVRHRLRSQGVSVPEPEPAPTVAHLPDLDERLEAAFATPLDPMGARQVWWLLPHPTGGLRVFEAVIDAAEGVLRFEVYQATRSQARDFVKRVQRHGPGAAVELDRATAQALVLRASEAPGAAAPPPRWIEWRGRLGAAGDARLPGELVREALEPPEGREGLDRAVRLVAEGAVGPWPPSREVIAALLAKLRTVLDSPLVVSDATRREQVTKLVDETAREIYGGDAGPVAALRLREMAFVFWRAGDEERARACLAGALSLEDEAAGESPVARAFIERWLAPMLAAAGSEEGKSPPAEDESPLLVRP